LQKTQGRGTHISKWERKTTPKPWAAGPSVSWVSKVNAA